MPSSSETLGKYQIVREIARSNDIVWEAVDPELGRRVAIKELNLPEGLSEAQRQERIQRFEREARATARLKHPNIVVVHDVASHDGRHYIVMEYLEGENLRERLQRQAALSLQEAVDITLQVLSALEHAHQQGVIHRDIKPENIHLLPDGLVKLTDFGIARLIYEDNITIDGQIFGTPSYMSPEQIEGKDIDHRTDLFSVGVVLYEMLTGRKPFTGESIVTITYNIMHKEPTPPPGVPYGIERVLMRALAKRAADRYASAREMAEDLKNAMQPGALVLPPVVNAPTSPSLASMTPVPQAAPDPPAPPPSNPKPPPPLPPSPQPWWLNRYTEAMKQVVVVLLIGLFIVVLSYGVNLAYVRYHELKRLQMLNAQMSDGVKLAQAGNYREAFGRFAAVYERTPDPTMRVIAGRNAATCLIHLGDELRRAGNLYLAANYYRQALYYDPASVAARERLDSVMRQFSRDVLPFAPLSPPLAAPNSATPLETSPRFVENEQLAQILYQQGVEALQRGDSQRALELWRQAIEAAPSSTTAEMASRAIQRLTAP